jgi:hypothetical protein
LPLTADVLAAHLKGDAHVGVYPLLDGDRCWWLAADFDGQDALTEALMYVKAGRVFGVPVTLDVSRSGVGMHAWSFFAAPVPAETARRLGTGLPVSTKIRPEAATVVRARLGSGIRVELADLTPALAASLRHAASMHNPQFYEKQRMRASTWDIPPVPAVLRQDHRRRADRAARHAHHCDRTRHAGRQQAGPDR